ncbi:uncharacterized protein LOC135804610 [Sycon ciliatum]|uniref:uncharacterized protein LOC135804610 n=1 Tax=Sycon ciliatum TaxID=27933 RepID=UPI0031F6D95B
MAAGLRKIRQPVSPVLVFCLIFNLTSIPISMEADSNDFVQFSTSAAVSRSSARREGASVPSQVDLQKAAQPAAADTTRVFRVGLLLSELREADVPWLVQCQAALHLAVERINEDLAAMGDSLAWRLEAKMFDETFLKEHLERISKNWHNASEQLSVLPVRRHPGQGMGKEKVTAQLDDILTLLQMENLVALIAVKSDGLVRMAAPLASRLGIPLFTTSSNARLRSAEYKTLLRANLNDAHLHYALRDVLLEFHWHNASLVYAVNGDSAAASLFSTAVETASSHMISIKNIVQPSLAHGNRTLSSATKSGLLKILNGSVRIIVVRVHSAYLPLLFDYGEEIGLLGPGEKQFTWVLLDLHNGIRLLLPRYWKLMTGMLVLMAGEKPGNASRVHNHSQGKQNHSLHQFAEQLRDSTSKVNIARCPNASISELSIHAVYVYDATIVVGHAVQRYMQQLDNGTSSASLLHRDAKHVHRLPGVSLRPLEKSDSVNFMNMIENVSSVELEERVLSCCSRDYALVIVQDHAYYQRVGKWSGQNLSLIREIREKKLHKIWGNRFPADGPVSEKPIRILLIPDIPFIVRNSSRTVTSHNSTQLDQYSGTLIDIWKNISKFYDLQYEVSIWNESRWKTTRDIIEHGCSSGEFDVALGAISERSARKHNCSFSLPFYFRTMGAVTLRPPDEMQGPQSLWGIFKPFAWQLWVILVVSMLLGGGVLAILDPDGLQTARRGNILFDIIFFSFATMLGFGEHNVKQSFARVFILCLQFMLLVIIASYTATLTKILNETDKAATEIATVRSLADFVQKRVGYVRGTDSGDYISNLLGVSYRMLVPMNHASQARQKLLSGKIDVFFTHGAYAAAMVARDKKCRFIATPITGATQKFSFLYNPRWQWQGIINHRLRRLNVDKTAHNITERLTRSTCKPWMPPSGDLPITATSLVGLLVIAATASVLAVVLKVYFHSTPRRRRLRQLLHYRNAHVCNRCQRSSCHMHACTSSTADNAMETSAFTSPYSNWCEHIQ